MESSGTTSARQVLTDLRVRPFRSVDAESVAALVRRCLVEVNSRDYSEDVIGRLCEQYSAARFPVLAREREVHVAECGRVVVGTVSRAGSTVHTLFVDPEQSGRGVARMLMARAERDAAAAGHDRVEADASITARAFYLHLGYTEIDRSEGTFGLSYRMRKLL